MSNDNVIHLIQPGISTINSQKPCATGHAPVSPRPVEAEVADFLGKHADLKTQDGHQRFVRHGHLPEREVMTGVRPDKRRNLNGPVLAPMFPDR